MLQTMLRTPDCPQRWKRTALGIRASVWVWVWVGGCARAGARICVVLYVWFAAGEPGAAVRHHFVCHAPLARQGDRHTRHQGQQGDRHTSPPAVSRLVALSWLALRPAVPSTPSPPSWPGPARTRHPGLGSARRPLTSRLRSPLFSLALASLLFSRSRVSPGTRRIRCIRRPPGSCPQRAVSAVSAASAGLVRISVYECTSPEPPAVRRLPL